MKTSLKIILSILGISFFIWACSSNDDTAQMIDDDVSITDDVNPTDDVDPTDDGDGGMGAMEMTNIQVVLPQGVDVDLTTTSILTLGEEEAVSGDGAALLPFNTGTVELGYLLDNEDNILLLGFLSD